MTDFEINKYGFVLYPKNHLGRDINLLKAIVTLELPTAAAMAEAVTSTKATVARTIQRLNKEALVKIVATENSGYKVIKWGGLYSKKTVLAYDDLLALR